MSTAPTKRAVKTRPRRGAAKAAEPAKPELVVVVPFGAVDRKIGEGAGNLQARSEAFKRRHRLTK